MPVAVGSHGQLPLALTASSDVRAVVAPRRAADMQLPSPFTGLIAMGRLEPSTRLDTRKKGTTVDASVSVTCDWLRNKKVVY